MLTIENSAFQDWKDFFNKRLTIRNHFMLTHSSMKGDTDIEVYTQQVNDLLTTIEIGYLSKESLIYLHIFHPDTPGHNKQQQIEHFYKYSFSNDKTYGGPGLDFDIDNLNAINRLLTNGLKGKETLYYRNGRLIKSDISLTYGVYTSDYSFNFTYHFNDNIAPVRLLKRLFGVGDKYEVRNVNLESIFSGLK
jgi:hypothetical protein